MSKSLQEEMGCMNPESWGLLLQSAVWYLALLVILRLPVCWSKQTGLKKCDGGLLFGAKLLGQTYFSNVLCCQ